jgi:hypothetical protein
MSDSPVYQGTGQPSGGSAGGILGWLTGIFGGGGTPAYSGDGQPSPGASGGLLGSGTPVYRSAPVATPPTSAPPDATAMTECPSVDPDPFGSGPIAIVIPRGLTSPQQ